MELSMQLLGGRGCTKSVPWLNRVWGIFVWASLKVYSTDWPESLLKSSLLLQRNILRSDLQRCIIRRPVNRNFTKPGAIRPPVSPPSSFERIVRALNISPGEYRSSPELKESVSRN